MAPAPGMQEIGDDASMEREVVALHRLIEEWLDGRGPRTPDAFAWFAESHAREFTFVPPDGVCVTLDEIVARFEGAHGRRPGVSIEIRAFSFIGSSGDLGVARYEEWQSWSGGSNARTSLVVMRREPGTRHGWVWLALHEAWLPEMLTST